MPPIQKPLLPSGRAVLKHGRSMLCSGNLSYDVNSTIKAPECKRGMGFTQFKRLATRLGKTRLRELPTTMMRGFVRRRLKGRGPYGDDHIEQLKRAMMNPKTDPERYWKEEELKAKAEGRPVPERPPSSSLKPLPSNQWNFDDAGIIKEDDTNVK
ncbi:hypothetical protein Pmar_PMAR007321 [Perkinsus marinus ATCC 50983]|uniref:Uncharacterized protein n=1 Tax=Perkinsus marinus (strain ATCC 50983 / TXsc) TaxID=423536 RepID=C5K630_PERM5|nr:hypothetical protein Pmar_PMAR007321 [Perkinsus marinus ATCC 50983]EER20060.1 hypothetical protein Pmar_PMAR007321 [Perkinsus marinus ATCC 50983]|eukprot:XP_002788264.1 hypothetical protein Pmar_PMAR007321 [Perkinsus marinus ATCC 50983]